MKTHYQILIIGGGNAGISAAAQLLRKNNKLDIGIIEPSEKHYYQPAWTLVGGGVFDITKTIRQECSVIPQNTDWIKAAVNLILPEQNAVSCSDGTIRTYDYLIVAPGIQLDWDKVKGLRESLGKNGVCSNYTFATAPYTWETLKKFKGGNAIFTAPSTPVKCGGAPQKIMYLAADHIGKQGLAGKSQVHFYSGGSIIFGVKKYEEVLNEVVERYGIQTHFGHNLVAINGEEKIATFEALNADNEKAMIEQPFDMIHVTPPQSAPDFIKQSPLAVPNNPLG